MLSDLEIARENKLKSIKKISSKLNIEKDRLFLYGDNIAKVSSYGQKKNSKLILVTAINPTKYGEGKTTMSIGLADGLSKIGKSVSLALREPSLGPVFGIKGGACGGGYSQIVPMEEINLHFTGDFHAITAANNLLSAMIDNHIFFGNELGIETIEHKRCLDVNDRALRDRFNITAASEVMAILALCKNEEDLLEKLGNIICGFTKDKKAILARQLNAHGAMATLLKDAIKPNLVQTLEGTPCFVHAGPFANIAHGCNSIISTKMALSYSDYCVTEAGFGADLGAEKFLNIKCRVASLKPDAVVLVATMRALGGDFSNLERHIKNLKEEFGLSVVVCINKFHSDTEEEISLLKQFCETLDCPCEICESFAHGGEGAIKLAKAVVNACNQQGSFSFTYKNESTIEEKVEAVAKKIYKADGVEYTPYAKKKLEQLLKYSHLPICIAKTQYSFSDNKDLLGAPTNFSLTVKDVQINLGAGFLVIICGDMLRMPGLSKAPSAEKITIKNGQIEGLF